MELVELKALKPFVGSFPCELKDADILHDHLHQRDDGMIVKQAQPRKKFIGTVPVTRRLTVDEVALFLAGQLPPGIDVIDGAEVLARHAKRPQSATAMEIVANVSTSVRNVRVPREMADSLIARGLAELVSTKRRGSFHVAPTNPT